MRFLSLFSGIGLHDLGLEWAGMQCAGQCEIDEYCNSVLERHWPNVPRWKDIRHVNRDDVNTKCGGMPNLITGGFPCQQISCAGKGAGIGTESSPTAVSGLWWEMRRVITECRPDWLLIENVPALRTRGADEVFLSLETIGYTGRPFVVGAEHIGAPHRRHRVWIVANAGSIGREWNSNGLRASGRGIQEAEVGNATRDGRQPRGTESAQQSGRFGTTSASPVADANGETGATPRTGDNFAREYIWNPNGRRSQVGCDVGGCCFKFPAHPGCPQFEWEHPRTTPIEPRMGRATNGRAGRVAKLKALGNANPPQIPYLIGTAIIEANNARNHAS